MIVAIRSTTAKNDGVKARAIEQLDSADFVCPQLTGGESTRVPNLQRIGYVTVSRF